MAEPNAEKAPENPGQDTPGQGHGTSRPKRARRWTPSKYAVKAEAAPEPSVETPAKPATIEYQASSAAAALIARAAQAPRPPSLPAAHPAAKAEPETELEPQPETPAGDEPGEDLAASDVPASDITGEADAPDEMALEDQDLNNQEDEPIGVVEEDDTSPDEPHEDAACENALNEGGNDTADLDISSDDETDDTPETTGTPARSNTLAARRFKRWTPVKYQTKDDIQVETMADETPPVAETGAPSKPKRTFKHWKPAKLHDEAEHTEAEPVETPSIEPETAQPRNFKHWKPAALRAEDSAAGDEQDTTASKPVEPELKPSPRQFKHWKPAALAEEAVSEAPHPAPEPAKPAQPKKFKHWKPAAQRAEEDAVAQQRAEQDNPEPHAKTAKTAQPDAQPSAAEEAVTGRTKPAPKVSVSARVNGADISVNDLEALPGIGSALIEMLNRAGIDSLETLAEAEADALRPQLGPVGELINLNGWIEFANTRKSA